MKKFDATKDLEEILERLNSNDWKTRAMATKELLKVAQQIPDEKKYTVYFAFLRCIDWENDSVHSSWMQYFHAITENVSQCEKFIAQLPPKITRGYSLLQTMINTK